MANIIELCEEFAIEESSDGRFLIDNWTKKHPRLVSIGDNEITYINPKRHTGYYNFKVKNSTGVGLMQLICDDSLYHYADITGKKHCDEHILKMEDVLTIPTEYEDVSVQHMPVRFGVHFPIAYKHGFYRDVFVNGSRLTNARGNKVFVNMQLSKATFIPQIISYDEGKVYVVSESDEVIFSESYRQFPALCFIKNADNYSSICPSYEQFKTDIWMYNASDKVGIVYLDDNKDVQSYLITEFPFFAKDNVYFINENYIIYDFHGILALYFKGEYIGRISFFDASSKEKFFVHVNNGFYIGKTFFKDKDFDTIYLRQEDISDDTITLRSGPSLYNFSFNPLTGSAVKI